jgi:MazG family protein
VETARQLSKLYCESLDRYVAVRAFSTEQALELLRSVPAGSKQEYATFLIRRSVVNFDEEIAPLFARPACNEVLADVITQELYSLCVRANPALEVRSIELPGTGDQVRRFVESLDRWVAVRRLPGVGVARLQESFAGLPAAECRRRVVEAVFPGLGAGTEVDGADRELEVAELVGIAMRVNPALAHPALGLDVEATGSPGHATAAGPLPDARVTPPEMPAGTPIEQLLWVMDRLRDPERGCPWDRQQDHTSLKTYLVEETHEVLEAIDAASPERIAEELGDLLMQVVFHARLGKEVGTFDFQTIASGIMRKLVTRHPHVFAGGSAKTPEDVIRNWEAIKLVEKKKESVIDGVPESLPTLLKSFRLQEKGSLVASPDGEQGSVAIADRLVERVQAFARAAARPCPEGAAAAPAAVAAPPPSPPRDPARSDELERSFGDLLFVVVHYGRLLSLNAEFCLQQANRRFAARYRDVEKSTVSEGRSMDKLSLAELEARWERIAAPASAGGGSDRQTKQPAQK